MRKIIICGLIIFLFIGLAQAKTLVKYNKFDGSILQINNVDRMPSQEILDDRFRTEYTDVILVEEAVDISRQKVDLNTKQIVDISPQELEKKNKIPNEIREERGLIEKELEQIAIKALKDKGVNLKHFKEE